MANKLEIDILINDKAALAKLNTAMGKLKNSSKKTTDQMNLSWTALASKVFVAQQVFRAVTVAMDATIGKAIEFESAFAGVRKTVEATEEEFAKLRKGLLDMSRTIPTSVNRLAKIQELAGQLGVKGVKNLLKFTDTVAKIAVTTDLTEEAAATSFARIANVMQEPIENIDRMASAVVDLGNNFATTESEIVNFALRIGGAGRIAGLTTDEIFAIGAAMSSVGVKAEAGGTAVQKVLISLKQLGFEGRQSFQNFVDLLADEGDGAFDVLEKLGLQNQRLIRAFLSLAGAGDTLMETFDRASKATAANTAAELEAQKRFETTAGKIGLMKNAWDELAISIGEFIKPAYQGLIEIITKAILKINEFNALPKPGLLKNDPQTVLDPDFKGDLPPATPIEDFPADFGAEGGGEEFDPIQAKEERLQEESDLEVQKEQEKQDQLQAIRDQFRTQELEKEINASKEAAGFFTRNTDLEIKAIQLKWKTAGKLRQNFQTGMAGMFKDMIRGTFSAEKAFKKLGFAMVDSLIDFGVQMVINAVLSKTLMAAQVATSSTAAATTAVAWTPAAAVVSLATFGANSVAAAVAVVAGIALIGAAIAGLKDGGKTTSSGSVLVGEGGPEILNLPKGASVIPLDHPAAQANSVDQVTGGNRTVEVHFHGTVNVRDEEDINEIALQVSTILDTERSRL